MRSSGANSRGAQPSFVGPPLTPCRRHVLQRLSARKKQTSHAQTTPTTFNITYRRVTKVYSNTTERAQARDYSNCSVRARTANMGAASKLPECKIIDNTDQALNAGGVKSRRSEQASRKKQPVRAAAAVGGGGAGAMGAGCRATRVYARTTERMG